MAGAEQDMAGASGLQGGTLKIYGETLKPDVPYKTLLLSIADTVQHVIKEAMEKYGVDTEDTSQFVLVEVLVPPGEREYHGGTIGEERILDDSECPLAIAMQHPPNRGMLMFHIKRKNHNLIKSKSKHPHAESHEDLRTTAHDHSPVSQNSKLPLVELNPDGTENQKGRIHRLHLDVTEVGSERSMSTGSQYLQKQKKAQSPQLQQEVRQKQPLTQSPQETNFDMDGRVETMNEGPRPQHPQRQESRQSAHSSHHGSGGHEEVPRGSPRDAPSPGGPVGHRFEDALPAALEFREDRSEGTSSAAKSSFCQTLSMERWKYDFLHVEGIPNFSSVQVKISTEATTVHVEGEEYHVLQFCNTLCELEQKICRGQININEYSRLVEFLKRATVEGYINECLMRSKINCHWELNSEIQGIYVYVSEETRLLEACNIIGQSYCLKKVTVLSHLSQTCLWKAKVHTLRNTFNDKVDFQVNSEGNEVSLLCTQDVEKEAMKKLHNLEDTVVLKVKSGIFCLLSQFSEKLLSGVNITTQGDQHCLVFDGEENVVLKAKFSVNQIIRKIQQQKMSIEKSIPLSFLKNATVRDFICNNLKEKNLQVHWAVNETENAIDVYALDDKLQEACNTIQQSYIVEKFDFSNIRQCFDLFLSKINVIKKQNIEKLTTIVDDLVVHVVCTTDILPEVKEIKQKCENDSLRLDFPCKDVAVYDFIKKHPDCLDEVKQTHAVSVAMSDENCMFLIKGQQEPIRKAHKSLQVLVNQKISKVVIPVCEKWFVNFQNRGFEKQHQELENSLNVIICTSEASFEDVKCNMKDNDIVFTNKPYKIETRSETAVVVWIEDCQGSDVKVRKQETYHMICCSCSLIRKPEGGKILSEQMKLFTNILEEAGKRGFGTLLIRVEELLNSLSQQSTIKFVKLFLQSYQSFIEEQNMHSLEVVFEICDRNKFATISQAASKYVKCLDMASLPKSTAIKMNIEEGELAKTKADVLVDAVGTNLDLSLAAVSSSLSKAAGKGLQKELKSKSSLGKPSWGMLVTDGYYLPCQKVYHLILDSYQGESEKVAKQCLEEFESLLIKCLTEMNRQKYKSIAFPVLGTGQLGYSAEQVADVMMNAAEKYTTNNPISSIESITVVIYPKGSSDIRKVFQDRLQRYNKWMAIEEPDEVDDGPSKFELVIVGMKENVHLAKEQLLERFKEEERETTKEKKKQLTASDVQRPAASNRNSDLNFSDTSQQQESKDISELDKLLKDVKVEILESFIKKLPDESILKTLGFFNVKFLEEDNMCCLKGKLVDLEKVGNRLKSIVMTPKSNHIKTISLSPDSYDLICSKSREFKDRLFCLPETCKVQMLDEDTETKTIIEKYKQYQFVEILSKCSNNGNNNVEQDERTAQRLMLDRKSEFYGIECFISPRDKILKVAGPNYELLIKFKQSLEIMTGNQHVRSRPGRSEATTLSPNVSTNTEFRDSKLHYPPCTSKREEFFTKEGIRIYVYKHSILRLKVDCIVNAANMKMEHGGGVAEIIAKAAGPELVKESKWYIKRHGKLHVGSCCTTTAGKLPYKYVIHTVGPEKNSYWSSQYSQMRKDLCEAVKNCFFEADKQNCASIGMTSVSSGSYGVPKDWCAEEYALAVTEYSHSRGKTTKLKEIHFVDINDEMLFEINEKFKKKFSGSPYPEGENELGNNKERSYTEDPQKAKAEMDGAEYPRSYYTDNKWVFKLNPDFGVIIYTGSITEFKTGVIACSQDTKFSSTGSLARALENNAGYSFKESLKQSRQVKTGDVFFTEPGKMNCAGIIHVVFPEFTSQIGWRGLNCFLGDTKRGYVKCFQAANERGYAKIAISLFGCDVLSKYVDQLAETFKQAVLSYTNDLGRGSSALREIHVINIYDGVTHKIKKAFIDYTESIPKLTFTEGNNNGFDKGAQSKTSQGTEAAESTESREGEQSKIPVSGVSVDDTCPICMDEYVNPKKLQKCGHVFCTECIESQFKVSPKCPNCFMVYGIITGDQPKGNMHTETNRYQHLTGFEDVDTIVITYSFSSGIQGDEHPEPGARYKGILRKAYLPDNKDGRQVLELLRIAFDRRLVFTIGSSRTTGHEGVITWNDIHHKTDPKPYTTFGYPDPTYLDRVKEELAAKGVTPADLKTNKETEI